MKIVLISGKQGSGKSTIAGRIFSELPNAVIYKFADPLYELHDACLPILKKHAIRSERLHKDGELLQILGTEYGRKLINKDIWVHSMVYRVAKAEESGKINYVIIDDCRFPNELEAFPQALTVRLVCREAARRARCSYFREKPHESETALDAYEMDNAFKITLDTDTTDIETCVRVILNELMVIPRVF